MAGIRTTKFRGVAPKNTRRLLADNYAQIANNCKIGSGGLYPYKQPLLSASPTLSSSIKTMYRYRKDDLLNWLVWENYVSVVGSPIAQDVYARVYWASEDHEPRMTTYGAAISSLPYPTAFFVLGVEPPKAAMAVTPTGGSAPDVTRAYVHTLVTQYGEESGPSAAVTATGKPDGTWNLGTFGSLPSNTWTVTGITLSGTEATVTVSGDLYGTYQHETVTIASATGVTAVNATWRISSIVSPTQFKFATTLTGTVTGSPTATRVAAHNTTSMTRRIYRSESSGSFLFVAEQAAATTTYADSIASTALGEALNEDIRIPPKNGFGLIALPNGCHVMIAGNEICFSEPFRPHSYPTANRYSRSERSRALVSSQNSVIILNDSFPVIATATQPESVSFGSLSDYVPCASPQGVTPAMGGAIVPSYDGLWLVTPNQAMKLTETVYEQDQWALLKPETFVGAYLDQTYHAQYTPDGGVTKIFVFDVQARDSATFVEYESTAIYSNPQDGKLYVSKDSKIYEFDADEANPMLMYWKGKEHQFPKPLNMGVAQVYAEYGQITPADTSIVDANTALMADPVDVFLAGAPIGYGGGLMGFGILLAAESTAGSVAFELYDASTQRHAKSPSIDDIFRLPSGYLSDKTSFAVASTVPVFDVAIGETVQDIQSV